MRSRVPLRAAKALAALCSALILLLSFVGESMGGHPLSRVNWLTATIVLPTVAVGAFVWSTLQEDRSRALSLAIYLAVIATPVAWFALTRP
jgi:hypothetical protein